MFISVYMKILENKQMYIIYNLITENCLKNNINLQNLKIFSRFILIVKNKIKSEN